MTNIQKNLKVILESDQLSFFCELSMKTAKGNNWERHVNFEYYKDRSSVMDEMISRANGDPGWWDKNPSFIIDVMLPLWEFLMKKGLIECEGYILDKK